MLTLKINKTVFLKIRLASSKIKNFVYIGIAMSIIAFATWTVQFVIEHVSGNIGKPDTYGPYAEWVSGYVEAASVGFFAYTVWLMITGNRTTSEGLRYDKYQELRDHHHDLMRLQMEYPELLDVYKKVPKPTAEEYGKLFDQQDDEKNLTSKDARIFNFYVAEFDLYERVFEVKQEGVIKEEEWLSWLLYLEKLSHHWIFRLCYNSMCRIFDNEFMMQIRDDIISKENAKEHIEMRIKECTVNNKEYIKKYRKKKEQKKIHSENKDETRFEFPKRVDII